MMEKTKESVPRETFLETWWCPQAKNRFSGRIRMVLILHTFLFKKGNRSGVQGSPFRVPFLSLIYPSLRGSEPCKSALGPPAMPQSPRIVPFARTLPSDRMRQRSRFEVNPLPPTLNPKPLNRWTITQEAPENRQAHGRWSFHWGPGRNTRP